MTRVTLRTVRAIEQERELKVVPLLQRVVLARVLQGAVLGAGEFVAAPHLIESVEVAIDRDAGGHEVLDQTALGGHVIEWQTETAHQGRQSCHVHVGRGLIDHIDQLARALVIAIYRAK